MTEAIEKEVVPVGHKRTYRTVAIQQLDEQKLRTALGERAIVAIDIAKTKVMVGFATPAVVALMRKIARAMVYVAKGHAFDAERLFDARRLRQRPEGSTPTELASATA